MKKTSIIFAAIVMMAFFATKVMAQVTTPNDAFAEITDAITLTATAPLEFGAMTSPTLAGTVVLSPAGLATPTNMVLIGAHNAAAYDVAGYAGATYTITLPGTPVTLNSAFDVMTVDAFTSSKATGTGTLVGGIDAFTVGATLHIAIGQPNGAYSGTFDVTVNYN